MENYRIQELIKKIYDQLGDVNRYPTVQEFLEISKLISKLPIEHRTVSNWKKMSMKYVSFSDYFTKGLDFSDINSVHQELLNLLKK